eukprot:CAMPEP_0172490762 /NCGR_PEP_ID=MMETSP1066-20121228/21305_1 /TAXON_ID=671091 /ORGANISM="Coscinodiscus wailesii, Strain CCMP2513" /LENGTH=63 /DNA_ID=CAMNT_0013259393 /DNA_START=317 /DNA_END=508 /DNA_ORIENTATION=+
MPLAVDGDTAAEIAAAAATVDAPVGEFDAGDEFATVEVSYMAAAAARSYDKMMWEALGMGDRL